MSNTPHTLQEEFPGEAQKMTELKVGNAHFARISTMRALVTEEEEEGLRRQRSRLKDEIARMLRTTA